jgi:trigger factor
MLIMAEKDSQSATEETTVTDAETTEEEVFVEDPEFDVDYKGDCAYEVKVSVPPANQKKQAEDMFEELSAEAEVPGFRRGRAPRPLLERKFSKAVQGEVAGKLVNAAFQKLIKDKDLNPITFPDVDGIDEEEERNQDEPLNFTLKFEVAPRVELGTYRGVEIERPVLKVTKKDAKEAIDQLKERHATYESLKSGKAAEGDQVVMDFTGTIDGEAFQGGSATDYPYILGTQRFFPEFEEVLAGASKGDDLSCEVNFPEDYHGEDVRGKTAQFAIAVKDIKRKKTPKLTDDFAKTAGYESADDLKEKVESQLREGASAQSDRVAEANALDAVVESSTFEIPKSVIEGSANDMFQQEVQRLLQSRVPQSEIQEREEELRKQAEDSALADIKRITALNEIGDAEGIEVTDEDMDQEIASIAERAGVSSEVVGSYLEQEGQRNTYEARIFRSKALSIIIENAKITDKEVSRDELEEDTADESE